MNESLRYTVQYEQNVMFRPAESIMYNYVEAQRLHSLVVSTNNNESAEFYSNIIMLLSNYVSRYVSKENNDK